MKSFTIAAFLLLCFVAIQQTPGVASTVSVETSIDASASEINAAEGIKQTNENDDSNSKQVVNEGVEENVEKHSSEQDVAVEGTVAQENKEPGIQEKPIETDQTINSLDSTVDDADPSQHVESTSSTQEEGNGESVEVTGEEKKENSQSGVFSRTRGNQKGLRHHHRKQNPMKATLVTLILICMLAGGQVLLISWKKNDPKSFTKVTLVGLWLIPLAFNVMAHHVRFIFLWTCFTLLVGRLLQVATKKPLDPKTPQRVYLVLDRLYRACNVIGTFGYGLIIVELMGLRLILHLPPEWVGPPGITLLFYGLYFGVMTRDFTEVAADRITNTIGVVKYEHPPHNLCALCGEELRPTLIHQREGEKPPEIFQLDCSHEFHARCVRGWTIVGKRDTCPFCSEKVDLKSIAGSNPWYQSQSLLWIQVLDTMRYMIVWNPVLLFSFQFVVFALGLNAKPEDSTAAPSLIPVSGHDRPS